LPRRKAATLRRRIRDEAARAARRLLVRVRATLRGERALYFVLFVLIGAAGGLVGSGFRFLGMLFQRIIFSLPGSLLEVASQIPWYMRVLTPAGGALLAGIVVHYLLRGAGGGGVAEVMESVALRQRSLPLRGALLKSLGSLFLMSSGGSVGREGPVSTLGAAIATQTAHLLRLTPARRNILIGCGVAAGMASVYNAPLGASLFVMEIIIANFAMDVFGPLVAASVMATLVSRGLWGAGPLYDVPDFAPVSMTEYFIFGFLGIPCAAAGNLFTRTLERGTAWLQALRLHPLVKITLGGAAVGAAGIWLPHVWGNGYDAVAGTLKGQYVVETLVAVWAGKMLATAVSLGSGGLGGVMTPTLLVGAAFGGSLGHLIHPLAPELTSQPSAYALVGLAGVLAATTHAPIMATFLSFELCQNYAMILPLGVCSGVAALMARRWKASSIYTEKLARKGVDLDAAIEESALQTIRVEDVLWPDPPTVPPGLPARALMEKFLSSRRHLMHVVDEKGVYYGLIAIQDMLAAAEDRNLDELVVAMDLARPMPSVSPTEPVATIMERFWFQEFGELPVLKGTSPPKFVGVVTRRDILGAFDREVLRRRILTARYRMGPERSSGALPVVGDYAVEEAPVPPGLEGRTLDELALPARFQITPVALKRGPAGNAQEIPSPSGDLRLEAGDRLVLMGRRGDIARFTRH
jgi:CIC family chloride channel protein